jgi:hypothetical protein
LELYLIMLMGEILFMFELSAKCQALGLSSTLSLIVLQSPADSTDLPVEHMAMMKMSQASTLNSVGYNTTMLVPQNILWTCHMT